MLQFEDVCVMSNLYEVQRESTYNAIGVSDRCECDGLSVGASRGRRVRAVDGTFDSLGE